MIKLIWMGIETHFQLPSNNQHFLDGIKTHFQLPSKDQHFLDGNQNPFLVAI
jgi:hypothetical protein